MLPEELKDTIQRVYRQLLESRSLTPRPGQRRMIAEIANSLAALTQEAGADANHDTKHDTNDYGGRDPDHEGDHDSAHDRDHKNGDSPAPVCVVEAGTGTGKTLGYILAVIPLAKSCGYKVVLSTATVALQEQVIYKDLPDIVQGSELEFSFALAKGRGRYLCLSKLDMLLQGNDSLHAMVDLFGVGELDSGSGTDSRTLALYQNMLEEINAGRWRGDRDEWDGPLSQAEWMPLTSDKSQCAGPRCSNFSSCFFYQARQALDEADCIVTNHDLVLSDLALGGGVVLPPPEKTLYILDEAHHLPVKSTSHFASHARVRGSLHWLEQCGGAMSRLENSPVVKGAETMRALCRDIAGGMAPAADRLNELWLLLGEVLDPSMIAAGEEGGGVFTFPLGVVPEPIRQVCGVLGAHFARITGQLDQLNGLLKDLMEEGESLTLRQEAEQWFAALGSLGSRMQAAHSLWCSFAASDPAGEAPVARWLKPLSVGDSEDISLSSSPVLAARDLQENLWRRCAGAVLTSATLSALGSFELLALRAGLPQHTRYVRIPSPFDYQSAAALVIPRLNCNPGDPRHTEVLVQAIPRVLTPKSAALMLFSSRRQMLDVLHGLPPSWRDLVLCQDDYQKAQLLAYHRQRIDQGEGSVIFGLASFAEGIDLPGKYCTDVLIAKIPFSVPDDPVEGTLAQWLETQGRNPFLTLSVPEAALRLVQASGRLLRSERDSGRITLFDERIVNKFYGRSILDSLPPYRREIFQRNLALGTQDGLTVTG